MHSFVSIAVLTRTTAATAVFLVLLAAANAARVSLGTGLGGNPIFDSQFPIHA